MLETLRNFGIAAERQFEAPLARHNLGLVIQALFVTR